MTSTYTLNIPDEIVPWLPVIQISFVVVALLISFVITKYLLKDQKE